MIIVVCVINANWPEVLGNLDNRLLWATLALVPLFLWGALFSSAYLGRGKVIHYIMFETGQRAVFMLTAIIALWFLHWGVGSYMTLVALSVGILILIYISLYFKSVPDGPILNLKLVPSAMGYGIRTYSATVVTFAVMRSGIFFVNYYGGKGDAGLFAIAQQMSELLVIVPSVIGTLLFSRIAGGNSKELTARVTRTTAAVFLPLFIILAVGRKTLITILFGSSFLPASEAFLILLPGTFFLGLEVIIASDIAGRGYPWPAALAWIPILIMNVIGYTTLIPRYGINGAAVSSTISFLTIFAFILWYYRRLSGQKLRNMFIIDKNDIRKILSIHREVVPARLILKYGRRNDVEANCHKSEAEIESIGSQA